MKKMLMILIGGTLLWSCNKPAPEETVAAPPKPVEFADGKYTDIGKQSITKLAEGDIDAFLSNLSDNAVYLWNNGDSITGKQAIAAYWKDRRTNTVDTITFKNEAWLPIQANDPPKHIAKGVWLFNWADFAITYTNGKTVNLNIHSVYHFDNSDKIDRVIQYLDRAPINAALTAKK